jgi:hypothetical protein
MSYEGDGRKRRKPYKPRKFGNSLHVKVISDEIRGCVELLAQAAQGIGVSEDKEHHRLEGKSSGVAATNQE